jgi:predicted RNA-binding Zn-ribbon protein involved in translation (DUF1610 family)
MGITYKIQSNTYKATDYIEKKKIEECWRCKLGITKDNKVVHYSHCGEEI